MFAALGFTTTGLGGGGPILVASMENPNGVVTYESGVTGDILVGGRKVPSPGNVSAGVGSYDGAGVGYLYLTATVAALLGVRTAVATALPAATDVGTFTTALSTGADNLVSLPSNFGPGRGNWTSADARRLMARIDAFNLSSAVATDVGGPNIWSVTVAAGNVTIVVRNNGLSPVNALAIELQYRHSISV